MRDTCEPAPTKKPVPISLSSLTAIPAAARSISAARDEVQIARICFSASPPGFPCESPRHLARTMAFACPISPTADRAGIVEASFHFSRRALAARSIAGSPGDGWSSRVVTPDAVESARADQLAPRIGVARARGRIDIREGPLPLDACPPARRAPGDARHCLPRINRHACGHVGPQQCPRRMSASLIASGRSFAPTCRAASAAAGPRPRDRGCS